MGKGLDAPASSSIVGAKSMPSTRALSREPAAVLSGQRTTRGTHALSSQASRFSSLRPCSP